ncbi:MAG TPA: hypothetical protein VER12_15250 [Polyangiaceae bacterium]|nr:hypothetical protein [Polyangiaceae bacterium]
MGRSWAKVSVVAIALAALVGCSSDPEPPDAQDDGRLHCNLVPNDGFYVTVKGTAQYTTEVTGDAVVVGVSYSAGDGQALYAENPQQPFSATVELEVGEYFSSASGGSMLNGSIVARDVFTPADGSAITVYELTCGTEPLP